MVKRYEAKDDKGENMAKTIKFNLILDEYPVRNLEGLREHFSIEDMLKYFKNGLLLRWLDVRGYKKEYEMVKMLDTDKGDKFLISELIKVFGVEIENAKIEEAITILKYLEEQKEKNAFYEKTGYEKKQIIEDYHRGYDALILHMEENKENMAVLKADAEQLEKEFIGLFELDWHRLYYRLYESAPKAIFAMLTKEGLRKYWIGENADNNISASINTIVSIKENIMEILKDDLKIVKSDTQAMWDQIERPETKIMVLSIAEGTFVKNAGVFAEKISAGDVRGKLLILQGLEYQSNSAANELRYMEV